MKRFLLLFSLIAVFATAAVANPPDARAIPEQLGNISLLLAFAVGVPVTLRAMGVRLPMWGLMITTISTSLLNTAYGSEFANNSKSQKDLMAQVFEGTEFDKLFKIEYINETVWRKGTSTSSAMTQGFQLGFTPNGTFTFKPSEIPLYDIKIDLLLSSHSIKREWIGFLHKNNVPQTEQEFVKYLLREHVANQHVEDIELAMCYLGYYVAPTPGTAGSTHNAMDGVAKVINDGIAASTITPINAGSMTTDPEDYVTYVETFVKAIDHRDRRRPMKLAVSDVKANLFKEGMMGKYNLNYNATGELLKVFHYQNIELVPQIAMADSTKMFCTPAGNAIKAVNQGSGPLFNFEIVDRTTKVFADYMMGYGFWDHSRVYTNDVETTDPAS